VVAGEVVRITAKGIVGWGDGSVGPAGVSTKNSVCAHDSTAGAYGPFLVPGLNCWSLVGEIDSSGTVPTFEVGKALTLHVSVSGELLLAMNDNYYPDNSGGWTVTIEVKS
jgi:hypothetical protein